VRRNRLLVASMTAVAAALAGGMSLALWQAHKRTGSARKRRAPIPSMRAAHAFASVAWRLAVVYRNMGSKVMARRAYEEAAALAESSHQRFPERRDALELLADVHHDYGRLYEKWHACGPATKHFQRALELYRTLNSPKQIRQAEDLIGACDSSADNKEPLRSFR
jgi:tetratricopeptide (TPR) repeat protein